MVSITSFLIIIGWIVCVVLISFIIKKYLPSQKELIRKIVHIGTAPALPLAWWLNLSNELIISISLIITTALCINFKIKLIPTIEDIDRKSYGTIAYGLSISLLLILFWSSNPISVCAGVLVMGMSDGLAGLIGSNFVSKSWKIFGQKKSLLGTLTMFVSTFFVLFIFNGMTINQLNTNALIAISSLATTIEQISPYGSDNLSIPIAVTLAWQLYSTN